MLDPSQVIRVIFSLTLKLLRLNQGADSHSLFTANIQ